MKKLLPVTLFSALGAVSALMFAQTSLAAEMPTVADFSMCTYKSGKGPNDLDKAVSYWQTQMGKIYPEGSTYFAAIMTPVLGHTESDFIWAGFSPNLNEWAAGGKAYTSSKEGQAANARFEAIADCSVPNSHVMTTLYQGAEPDPTDDNGVIEIFACTLNEGKTRANVLAAEQAWAAQSTALKLPLSSWRFNPAWANSPADLVYFVAHDDLKAFAANNTAQLTDPGAAGVNAGFADTMTCESWVKASQIVFRPTMTPADS
jgi:hypothetical protein